jgi:hypothetical protein
MNRRARLSLVDGRFTIAGLQPSGWQRDFETTAGATVMNRLRQVCIALTAICIACALVKRHVCIRYQHDKCTAYEIGVSGRRFVAVEETGPDVTTTAFPDGSGDVPVAKAFSRSNRSRWTMLRADFDAPPGRQSPVQDIRSIGAGPVAGVI